MKNIEEVITGQCHCGAIKYRAQGPVLRTGICTCRACQKATGALESPNLGVSIEHFEIVLGEPTQFRSDSNVACDSGVFNFCSECGSQLYWMDAAGQELAIFVGTLDDTNWFKDN